MTAPRFQNEREQLIQRLRDSNLLQNPALEEAFRVIPREAFVPERMRSLAYVDDALPLSHSQTISQPSTIAIMLEQLDAHPGMKVLEIGSGSGYVVALLAQLVAKEGTVFGIERVSALLEQSKKTLTGLGIENVEWKEGDGSTGWPDSGTFDRILLSASCPFVPKPVLEQLKDPGKLVAPVGDAYTQQVITLLQKGGKRLKLEYPFAYFSFVPLKGAHGWK